MLAASTNTPCFRVTLKPPDVITQNGYPLSFLLPVPAGADKKVVRMDSRMGTIMRVATTYVVITIHGIIVAINGGECFAYDQVLDTELKCEATISKCAP